MSIVYYQMLKFILFKILNVNIYNDRNISKLYKHQRYTFI